MDIYNFIHVEVKTDGTFEKLRVTGITYNPCIYQGEFTLTFSSMTRYKTRRNDFSDLLSSALSAQKNSLTLSAGNSKDVTTYTITPEFIKSLLGNSSFNAYMTKIMKIIYQELQEISQISTQNILMRNKLRHNW